MFSERFDHDLRLLIYVNTGGHDWFLLLDQSGKHIDESTYPQTVNLHLIAQVCPDVDRCPNQFLEILLLRPFPRSSKMLGELMNEKNIEVIPEYYIESVDNDNKQLISYDEKKIPFDILTIVPTNMGSEMVERSGMGDDLGFIPTDKFTLRSEKYENIFVIRVILRLSCARKELNISY